MKYRKKPMVVEAMQFWNGDGKNTIKECEEFVKNSAYYFSDVDGCLHIFTLKGEMISNNGDWIIKGIQGEFYACKPDIFEQTYERVTEEE